MDILSTAISPGDSTTGLPFQFLSRCGTNISEVDLFNKVELSIPFITLAFDIFIFGLTLRKTFKHAIAMRRLRESSVTQVIVRDGSIYFLIMLVVAIFNAIAYSINLLTASVIATFFDLISQFANILPNILIGRLVLNLHSFSDPEEVSRFSQSAEGQHYSGLKFATNSFLGNIGAPLDGGVMEDLDEE
ncbi:hypothetical protein GYMLUDRAFT_50871 [Collybiopsis luxurians FD-317 M1]|uniref:Uncharacterized protein n=1 Tax=Collybiopsis luxurians FD-317 M1 TaxID=944289 RepID=A0A0D0C077_9AGAR|nr:hypothetical protein GYMLUDRAFT_50871 [Collybiopsis luxurians FD-317 M1]